MTERWWGKEAVAMGWTCLLYDWAYVPLANWLGQTPWTVTQYGLILLGCGIVVNLIQAAAVGAPFHNNARR